MDAAHPGAPTDDERGLDQVLLDRRPHAARRAVEGDQPLRQLRVTQPLRAEQQIDDRPARLRRQVAGDVDAALPRHPRERVEEGEARQLGEEAAHLVGLLAAGLIGEERLEHPRRGAGGGDEPPDPARRAGARGGVHEARLQPLGEDADAVAGGARPQQARRRRRAAEEGDLPSRFFGRECRAACICSRSRAVKRSSVMPPPRSFASLRMTSERFRSLRSAAAGPASRRAGGRRGRVPRSRDRSPARRSRAPGRPRRS